MNQKAKEPAAPISPKPRAVVLDTNLWGNGILDLRKLRGHATRLARSGIEVWIPTQVLLEWVSHARNDVLQASPVLKRLARAGLTPDDTLDVTDDRDALLAEMTASINAIPNVRILEMTGEAAIAGIRDQILGTGPGTTVGGTKVGTKDATTGGVKTGAADSSLVRDAIAFADNDASQIVFVTKNKSDIYKTADAIGISVHVRDESNLYPSLFATATASSEVAKTIANHFEQLTTFHSLIEARDELNNIADFRLIGADLADMTEFEVTDHTVETAEFIGLRRLNVMEDSATTTSPANKQTYNVSAEVDVVLLGTVSVTGYILDNDGQVVTKSATLGSVVITIPFIADIEDLSVAEQTPTGPAYVETFEMNFDEPSEARYWLVEYVLDYFKDDGQQSIVLGSTDAETFALTSFTGTYIQVDIGDAHSEWTMTFTWGDDAECAEIAVQYDPGSRVWAGRDSFDLYPPWELIGSRGSLHETIAYIWRSTL